MLSTIQHKDKKHIETNRDKKAQLQFTPIQFQIMNHLL